MKRIFILILLLAFLGLTAVRINAKPPLTTVTGSDVVMGEDQSNSWATRSITMNVIRTFNFSSDILLTTQNLSMNFGLFTAVNTDIGGGNIDGTIIGDSSPASGTFTSIRGNGTCEFNEVNPIGAAGSVGASGNRWSEIWGKDLNVDEATIGDVSDAEIQRLDGVDGDLLYLGRGNESTTQTTYTGSTSIPQSDEGGHFLNNASAHSISLPSLSTLPIGWEIEFVNIGAGVWTILDNGADSGFGMVVDPLVAANSAGTSITIQNTGHVILRSSGITGKWLIVAMLNATLVP